MPSIPATLVAILKADAPTLAAVTSGSTVGIYVGNFVPQNAPYPFVQIAQINKSPQSRLISGEMAAFLNASFQVDCWGETWSGANALSQLVEAVLDGHKDPTVLLAAQRDIYDDTAKVHAVSTDYDVHTPPI